MSSQHTKREITPMHPDARFHWRPMVSDDLKAVSNLASDIHADFPESDSVLLEKLKLFPEGCYILAEGSMISGYLLSHPWKRHDPPALDNLLGCLPPRYDTYYIHDLALAGSARGHGMAGPIIEEIVKLARSLQLTSVSLVAVGGSKGFWKHQKFRIISTADLDKKLETYGAQAHYMERSVF